MFHRDAEVPALFSSVAVVVHFHFCWFTPNQVHQGQVRPYRFLDWVEGIILFIEHLRLFPRMSLFLICLWGKRDRNELYRSACFPKVMHWAFMSAEIL